MDDHGIDDHTIDPAHGHGGPNRPRTAPHP
jgi:hypothetical protein